MKIKKSKKLYTSLNKYIKMVSFIILLYYLILKFDLLNILNRVNTRNLDKQIISICKDMISISGKKITLLGYNIYDII